MWKELAIAGTRINISDIQVAVSLLATLPEANDILCRFSEREDSYTCVVELMKSSLSDNTKHLGLSIFQRFAQKRWLSISIEERNNYKCFLLQILENMVINKAADFLITKTDEIIVEILKYEWPSEWPTFVNDLLVQGQNPVFAENCLHIIKIIIQDMTDFSENSLTSVRAAEMLDSFTSEIPNVFSFIESVFNDNYPPNVIIAGFSAVKALFMVAPVDGLLQSNLFSHIFNNYIQIYEYTPHVFSILNELSQQAMSAYGLSAIIGQIFVLSVNALTAYFPDDHVMNHNLDESIVLSLIYTLTNFITMFSSIFEADEFAEPYTMALQWVFSAMIEGSIDLFRMGTDMWLCISRRVFCENIALKIPYFNLYTEAFEYLTSIVLCRMECPNEYILSVDDSGNTQKTPANTENTAAYYIVKELMVYLTNINKSHMISSILETLSNIEIGNTEMNISMLNSLCWAAGSIQGSLNEAEERGFISRIILFILQILDQQTNEMNSAFVAADMMYVCSQYTRFLNSYPELLYSVMEKLIEFVQEPIEALQESALSSLNAITIQCKEQLCKPINNSNSFLQNVVESVEIIAKNLSMDNAVQFYEIVCLMIHGVHGETSSNKYSQFLSQPIVNSIKDSISSFDISSQEICAEMQFCIRCVEKFTIFFGIPFMSQLEELIQPLIRLYDICSDALNNIIQDSYYNPQIVSMLKSLTGQVLTVFATPIYNSVTTPDFFKSNIIPVVFEHFVPNYFQSNPEVRSPQLLGLVSAIALKFKDSILENIELIFNDVYLPSVEMIKDDFDEFPAIRPMLLQLISNMISYCTQFIKEIPPTSVESFVECLKWFCSHPHQIISEKAIRAFTDLFNSIDMKLQPEVSKAFIEGFGVNLVIFVFELLTDSIHGFAFSQLLDMLRRLLGYGMIQQKVVQIVDLLSTNIFPKISPRELYQITSNLIEHSTDYGEFRKLLRNFLINEKKYFPRDPSLFKQEIEEIEKEIREKQKLVPGLGDGHKPAISTDQMKRMIELASFISGVSLH